ncbi:MAG: hypothetical protein EAZ91_08630 [Cytophagales bacterium]|nr:MAG: hypothetical protein EAZ91_08630 [Cytophagales bacterium]
MPDTKSLRYADTYAYDNADRLTEATYGGGTHSVSGITYDANGNILSMTRANADQLAYRYDDTNQSNKLLAVTDASSNTVGFRDGNTTGDDYDHWPHGSLKKDLNRGITLIEYNLLKLPRRVVLAGSSATTSSTVTYQYGADGRKLQMVVTGWLSSTGINSSTGTVVSYRQGLAAHEAFSFLKT